MLRHCTEKKEFENLLPCTVLIRLKSRGGKSSVGRAFTVKKQSRIQRMRRRRRGEIKWFAPHTPSFPKHSFHRRLEFPFIRECRCVCGQFIYPPPKTRRGAHSISFFFFFLSFMWDVATSSLLGAKIIASFFSPQSEYEDHPPRERDIAKVIFLSFSHLQKY